MSMLKITETSNQLVLRSQSPFGITSLLFKVAPIVPLAIAVGFCSGLGVESLNCQRHDADGINCVQKKTAWMGLKSLPEHSFTSISHAEYMQREEPTNDEDCSTTTYHEFYLMGKANWREQVFKPPVTVQMGCSVGNSGWIQEQVQNFNTSEAERFTIKQDTRLAPSSIVILGGCLGSVIFITYLFGIGQSRKFEFDRTTRMFRLIEYTWWVSPKTVMSSGFADLRVGLQSEEDDDSILYSITLMSKTGKPVFLDYSSDRQSMQEEANKIARFIGKKVEEIAPGNGATATVTEKAQELLEYHEQLYSQTHKFVRVNAQDFSHLDLKFYEQAQKELEGQEEAAEALGDALDRLKTPPSPEQ